MTTENQPKSARIAPSRLQLPADGLPTLQSLIKHLDIKQWDAIIVGDGSGVGWDMGAGWAGVLVDNYSQACKAFYGAVNCGTITLGEMFPYLHALSWYTSADGPGRKRRKEVNAAGRNMLIHIATDSSCVAQAGNNRASRKAHFELWAAFDAYGVQGYDLFFHHVPRDTSNLNILVDQLSRRSRLDLEKTWEHTIDDLQGKYPGLPKDVTVYDFYT